MIVRYESDGTIVMITQNDHAMASGLFAAHWGNEHFERPQPYSSIVKAAAFHDRGWIDYETAPRLNGEGQTPNYRDVPIDSGQLRAFRWASDWLSHIDPYAGLLSAKHRTGLWQGRYGVITKPPLVQRGTLSPGILAFIAESEAHQAQTGAGLDGSQLMVNYNLLQVWDMMSLYICSTPSLSPTELGPAPTDYAGNNVILNFQPGADGKISLDPWPFDEPSLTANVVYRRLKVQRFETDSALQEAYFKTPPAVMAFTFVRGACF
jgi:hypothetical protein